MMWASARRRSSASRREALRTLFGAILSVAAIAIGLVLLLVSRVDPAQAGALRGAALDVVAPVWTVARAPVDAVGAVVTRISDYFGAVSRNRRLERELEERRRDSLRAKVLELENKRLRGLIALAEPARRRVATARIAGGPGGSLVETAVLSAGARHGVRPGQPVLAAEGVLGRVLEVGAGASRVLLVSDSNSRVPVRVLRTGQPAILAGLGGGLMELRFVEGAASEGVVRVGDQLVTSGDGGIFPPDMAVAEITSATGDAPRARPLASPASTGFAIIETAYLAPAARLTLAAAAQPPAIAGEAAEEPAP